MILDSIAPSNYYIGSIPVSKIYLGATEVWSPVAPVFNPEAGLSLTTTFNAGGFDSDFEAVTGGSNWNLPSVLACDVRFPLSPSDGTLFEKGGSGMGMFLGYRDGGSWLRLRAGEGANGVAGVGGATQTANDIAVFDTQAFPTDDAIHTIVWDVRINPGRVRMWIDGVFLGEHNTVGGNSLEAGRAAGGGSGGYLTGANSNVGGEPNGPWPNQSDASTLRLYANQQVAFP